MTRIGTEERGSERTVSVNLLHANLTESIIGAAMEVLNILRPGLDEKLYENALVIELQKRGHSVEQQKAYCVYYKDVYVGGLVPDLIVDEAVLVDTKVVEKFADVHLAQMLGYLNITNLSVALLINFKTHKLDWKRVVR